MSAVAVKERPILFSGPMVNAIQYDLHPKTVTRRVVKPQPSAFPDCGITHAKWLDDGFNTPGFHAYGDESDKAIGHWRDDCPYGKPGDQLWVRETWGVGCRPCPYNGWVDGIEYRADVEWLQSEHDSLALHPVEGFDLDAYKAGWHPSIHMPRAFSRIQLEIIDIRVERLQAIDQDGAKAEGVNPLMVDSGGSLPWGEWVEVPDYVTPFIELWNNINAKRGYGWDSNPWVWVIEFKRITP